ncbi:hypothetical protein [Paucibacter sp. Y2R2-4]|uniref:hypothetical protein n=1 Tax=Paucibacter sp. Y2R2-4 TaxID=2893553 RepID=UPI0021E3A0FC|nr:hypothetical protein [Paucibacter sp. Y2R2-4]MCV2351740.1 hypothetical protein [Paucibacter sp. Y2R2-4]
MAGAPVVALALSLSLLAACGGGAGGGAGPSGDPAAPKPSDPASPSALIRPTPPAASGDIMVQAAYQSTVRELSTAAGAPQLLQSEADGTLVFSAAPGAQVGQVLIVAGRAYAVTALDARGTRLSTRVPELGEVFASLRVKAKLQEAQLLPAASAVRAMAANMPAAGTVSGNFAYDLNAFGPVGLSYKGQLTMTLDLDLDFTASSGFKTLQLTGDLALNQSLLLQLQSTNSEGGSQNGIELKRFSYAIPQTLGAVKVEVPIMLQGEAKGDAKVEMRVIDGETRSHLELRYDPISQQLLSSHRITGSAPSQPPTAKPLPGKSTTSLGLQLKVGPDLQLRVLDSVLPLSASLRANLAVTAQVRADGTRNCLGWKSELFGEVSAKLKLGGGTDLQAALLSEPYPLGGGGDLARCDAPPDPTPTPLPNPLPTPGPQDPKPVPAEGLTLLPLPVGAELLTGYQLALVPNTGLPLTPPDLRQQFNVDEACFQGAVYDVFDPAYHSGSPPVEMPRYCVQTLEPQLLRPDGRRIDATTDSGQDWVVRFDTSLSVNRCMGELFDPLLGLVGDGGVRYTRRRGEVVAAPLTSRTPPSYGLSGLVYAWASASHTNQFSLVCQMEMTERSSGKRYYLRTPLWVSPAGRVQFGIANVGWSNWLGQ